MTVEPLRSARSIGNVEDTSLALPSDSKLRTGHQRVLDQVHTIKRSKSKQSKSGPGSLSPTSPQHTLKLVEFSSFRFFPSAANGTFSRSNSNKTVSSQSHSKTVGRRHVSTSSQWDQRFQSSNWPQPPNGLTPSRSDPALAPAFAPAPVPAPVPAPAIQQQAKAQTTTRTSKNNFYSTSNGNSFLVTSSSRTVRPPSVRSQNETKVSITKVTKTEHQSGQPRTIQPPAAQSQNETKTVITKTTKTEQQSGEVVSAANLTLKEAVEFLSNPEENYQQCGASFIQHTTFKEERSKQEVLRLGGVPLLVALLGSPSGGVSQSAAAALRNLVFRDQNNKQEVLACGGIDPALRLLRETDSAETQKQLTGLLWNLSSADDLKGALIESALPVLTESVVVPFTCWSDSSANNNIHPEVFYSATGCLRNLSYAEEKERRAMRDCRGLIDSLVSYIQSCIAEDNPDDKSVENCVCILHNLTYQLEAEAPECFSRLNPPADASGGKKSPTIGCFSSKSGKIQDGVGFPVPEEEADPVGVSWLCHSKAMQMYLSLLSSSQKDATLEACCGALQNLTTNKGLVLSVMSQTLVQKLNGLSNIVPLLQSPNPSLQKTVVSLVGNLSRNPGLQGTMAKQVLPDLATLLTSGSKEMGNHDETIATTCHTARSLILADPETGKKVVSSDLVTSLSEISENESFKKANKAASLLLYSLWNDKSLQGTLKKLGMNKAVFVNEMTTAAHKSVQVID